MVAGMLLKFLELSCPKLATGLLGKTEILFTEGCFIMFIVASYFKFQLNPSYFGGVFLLLILAGQKETGAI